MANFATADYSLGNSFTEKNERRELDENHLDHKTLNDMDEKI